MPRVAKPKTDKPKTRKPRTVKEKPVIPLLRWQTVPILIDRPGLVNIPGTSRYMVLQVFDGKSFVDVVVI